MSTESYLSNLQKELIAPVAVLHQISGAFTQEMRDGLKGNASSLKMLPSFLANPSGEEVGSALAIDFGGTNLRVLEAQFQGGGKAHISEVLRSPLIEDGVYNFLNGDATSDALFGFIVDNLLQIAKPEKEYSLGHTFSFPCKQDGINSATLIAWTKEIKTAGVVRQDISKLLNAALAHKNVKNIHPTAIINDTVGTQLAAAYTGKNVSIGSICGTGHNTCYLDPKHPLNGQPMIVNMESGNFDKLPRTRFDELLDRQSDQPGTQSLEKMVSGHYLGRLLKLVLDDMATTGLLPAVTATFNATSFDGADVSNLLLQSIDPIDPMAENSTIKKLFGNLTLTEEQVDAARQAAQLIALRSARLVATTFVGVIGHIDSKFERAHDIAIDGSLYEKMPFYAAWIQETLNELSPSGALIRAIASKDGSGLGAAIAAIVAKQS